MIELGIKPISKAVGCFTVLILFGLGVYNILYQYEDNRCAMTYMYEYPKYIKVHMNTTVRKAFPKYSLFVYGEGQYAEYLEQMNNDYKLTGIPVVFAHGNAGRYKQVRSPASVSLRKSKYKRFHFNYFSVDYEEELSALYGPYLQRQTDFLHHAILRILKCYDHLDEEDRPKSVVAIGHSMGGVVIRGLFSIPTFQVELINVVINLATPQVKPVLLLDKHISVYYNKVNSAWINEANKRFENLTFLSLGGGFRDYLVRSDLCIFDKISSNKNHMSGLSTSLPEIWLENDHQCIVWCNQLVRALTRAFFNMIDEQSAQISSIPTFRASVLLQTLYHKNFSSKSLHKNKLKSCKEVELTKMPVISRSGCYWLSSVNSSESFSVWATNILRNQWLYNCHTDSCISQEVRQFLPGGQFQHLNDQAVVGQKHLLIAEKGERFLFAKATTDNSFTMHSPFILHRSRKVRLDSKTFYVSVNITGIREVWQTYNVTIKLNRNTKKDTFIKVAPTWSNESRHFTFRAGERIQFPLKFLVQNTKRTDTIRVHVWREEITQVFIQVEMTMIDGLAQMLRFNIDSLLRYIFVFSVYLATTKKESSILAFVSFYLVCRFQFMGSCCFTWSRLARYMLPEIVLLTFAYTLANVLQILIRVFLVTMLLVKALLIKTSSFCPTKMIYNGFKKKWFLNVAFIVAVLCVYVFIGESFCLILLLIAHLLITMTSNSNFCSSGSYSTLNAMLPIVLLFTTMPVIAYLQDITKGFPHQRVAFTNLNVLAISYVVLDLLLMNVEQSNTGTLSNGGFYIWFLVPFMFKELVEFYNLTHLLVVYIILNVFDVYSSTRYGHVKCQ